MSLLAKAIKGGRRIGWSAAAQIASNGSNFILTVLIARALEVQSLGLFAILMSVNGFAIGIVRAWTSEPMIFKEASIRRLRSEARRSASLAMASLAGACIGFLAGLTIYLVSGDEWLALAFGVSLPFSIAQDSVRFSLVDAGKASHAFVAEVLWLLTEVLIILSFPKTMPFAAYVGAWGAGAALSVGFGYWRLRPRLSIRLIGSWIRSVRNVGSIYAVDYLAAGGLTAGVTFIVSAIAGLEAAGWLRAAQMLLMPLSVFTLGMNFALVPEVTRYASNGDVRSMKRLPVLYGLVVLAISIVCVTVYHFVPHTIIVQLMGDAAIGGMEVLPYAAVALAVSAISVGPGLVLRAVGRVRASMLIKVVAAPITLLAVATGASFGGAVGSQWGLAGGTALRGTWSWGLMLTSTSSRPKKQVEGIR
ncbi:MATE family efflux transporter [Rhodococcus artemisiae]|uniref:O-antigen/teichoic acid export membrane protein n=1 Tax=Rhodococcus artemisiae TaxID=714159 RepID=A0ABU7LGK5_9NOCA|nr:hypothetical protein [Rhodococcus artemisiae]MEE2060389.1 hypothetical protein [Rhodococcus artemisiae]